MEELIKAADLTTTKRGHYKYNNNNYNNNGLNFKKFYVFFPSPLHKHKI
jgi:hypothetical protein